MAVIESANVARELDDRRLHAEADSEERKPRLASFANGFDHALDAPHAKTARDKQSVHVPKNPRCLIGACEVLAGHPLNIDADVVRDSAMDESFLNALVAVRIVRVL